MADRPEPIPIGAGEEFALQPGPDFVPARTQVPNASVEGVFAPMLADPGVGLGTHSVGGDAGEETPGKARVMSGRKSFANRLFSGAHFTDSIRSG